MSRCIAGAVFAIAGAVSLAANGQDTTVKTKSKSEGGAPQTVTYTGCVQTGTETRSYVLDKVVPVSQTTSATSDPTGATAGTMTTATTYALVPGDTVQITEYVGHKVEVTGEEQVEDEDRARGRRRYHDQGEVEDQRCPAAVPGRLDQEPGGALRLDGTSGFAMAYRATGSRRSSSEC
jgi:hypothetical protein